MSYDFSAYDDEFLTLAIQDKKANGSKNPVIILAMEQELTIRNTPKPIPVPVVIPERINIKRSQDCKGWLSDSDKDAICKLLEDGCTHLEAAMKVGVSTRTVQRVSGDALLTNFSSQVSYDIETMNQIVRLSNDRKSVGEIAAMLNLDNDVVRRWINKQRAHDIEMGTARFRVNEVSATVSCGVVVG